MENKILPEVLEVCLTRARDHQGTSITEQDTKNAIIEPLLEALGWPKQDLKRVRAEYRHTAGDNPVDYALLEAGRPLVFVEAKALDHNLDERKFVLQVLSYAHSAGVDWALLTNGLRWVLYDAFDRAPDLTDRKVFDVTLDEASAEAWVQLVLPSAVREGRLGRLRSFMKHEAKVHKVLHELLHDRDPAIIDLLSERTRVDPRAVATALGTFRISVVRAPLADMMQHLEAAEAPAAGPVEAQRLTSAGVRQKPKAVRKTTRHTQPSNPPSHPASAPPAEGPAPGATSNKPADAAPTPATPVARKPIPSGPMRAGETGARPAFLVCGKRRYPVSSWKTLCVETLRWLAENRPERYPLVFDHPDLQGRTRRHVSRLSTGMYSASEIPGGFVETNLSATNTTTVLNRIIAVVDPEATLDWV